MQVWIWNAGSTAADDAWLGTGYYVVGALRPLTVTVLTTSTPLPAVGMALTWTVQTDGGSGPLTYKFYRYVAATGTWLVQRDWGRRPARRGRQRPGTKARRAAPCTCG